MPAKRLSRIRKQIAALEAQAEKINKDAIQEIVSRIRSLMAEHGISMGNLGSGKRGRPAKGAKPVAKKRGRPPKAKRGRPVKVAAKKPTARRVKPKYRSPTDRKLTWSGRGRRPKWVQEWIDGGKKLEGLAIR